jgi:DNA invertase Pin-like site-specific DNA recombinase
MADSPLRAGIYARVSTADKGQEVENQLLQLREFCRVTGWSIVREYVDHETGSRGDREQFLELFADASQRKFDVVVFWALDRFSREGALATLLHLDRLSSLGVKFRSFTEQYIDTCGIFGEVIIALQATIAKQERVRISERVRAGLARARGQGIRLGRPRVGQEKKGTRREPSAAQIHALLASGASWSAIERELGVSRRSLKRILVREPGQKPRPGSETATARIQ